MSCTSKWRWPRTRQAASRTTAKASISRSSSVSPLLEALLELDGLVREGVVGERLHLGLEGVDERDELGEAPDLLALARLQDLGEHAHGGPILPVPASGETATGGDRGCVRLTWSLTPHSPAARVTRRHRRHGDHRRTQRHHDGAHRLVSARPRQPGTRRAGLTSKPHHAQRPQVALRGSFRLRLASTFNHRPARSPLGTVLEGLTAPPRRAAGPCLRVPGPPPRGKVRTRGCDRDDARGGRRAPRFRGDAGGLSRAQGSCGRRPPPPRRRIHRRGQGPTGPRRPVHGRRRPVGLRRTASGTK